MALHPEATNSLVPRRHPCSSQARPPFLPSLTFRNLLLLLLLLLNQQSVKSIHRAASLAAHLGGLVAWTFKYLLLLHPGSSSQLPTPHAEQGLGLDARHHCTWQSEGQQTRGFSGAHAWAD